MSQDHEHLYKLNMPEKSHYYIECVVCHMAYELPPVNFEPIRKLTPVEGQTYRYFDNINEIVIGKDARGLVIKCKLVPIEEAIR